MALYRVLGVSQGVSPNDLKAAYRRELLECHPDKAAAGEEESARERFDVVKDAYERLSDPNTRREYDRSLHVQEMVAQNAELVPLATMTFDDEEGAYCRTCRCGGEYAIYEEEVLGQGTGLMEGAGMNLCALVVVQCTSCSIHIKVDCSSSTTSSSPQA